jgi:hypothetical protein
VAAKSIQRAGLDSKKPFLKMSRWRERMFAVPHRVERFARRWRTGLHRCKAFRAGAAITRLEKYDGQLLQMREADHGRAERARSRGRDVRTMLVLDSCLRKLHALRRIQHEKVPRTEGTVRV